jgi:hypothetical protein
MTQMKIKSSFRDFYDFVAHQYGGGDPNIVYVRDRLAHIELVHRTYQSDVVEHDVDLPTELGRYFYNVCQYLGTSTYRRDDIKSRPYEHTDYEAGRLIVICGRPYISLQRMVREPGNMTYQPEGAARALVSGTVGSRGSFFDPFTLGVEHAECLKVSKLVRAPVFEICYSQVAGRCPILQELGFASALDPQTLYQDLSMFVGARVADGPDVQPPSPQTDIQKVDSHGFDRKQSFRHRT